MRTDLIRRWSGVVLSVLLVALAGFVAPATATDGEFAVNSAVLRWGMNNEANNRSPSGAMNFFSAGQIPKPVGGIVLQSTWAQSAGRVRIEKWNGSAYQAASWAGLSTDPSGVEITNPLSGRFSGHQYVFTGGTGTVDRSAGTAQINWSGSVSVIFYGGMVFFYLSDPELTVADGKATLRATVSGFGSSQENPGESFPVTPREVVVAELEGVSLGELGFNSTPTYDQVRTTVGGVESVGSFPQSFVSAMNDFGTAPFWRATGSSMDPAKKPLALTVSYAEENPQAVTPPPAQTVRPEVTNTAKTAPTRSTSTTSNSNDVSAALNAPVPPPEVPSAATPLIQAPGAAPVLHLVSAETRPSVIDEPAMGWWLGSGLFLVSLFVVIGSLLTPARRTRS